MPCIDTSSCERTSERWLEIVAPAPGSPWFDALSRRQSDRASTGHSMVRRRITGSIPFRRTSANGRRVQKRKTALVRIATRPRTLAVRARGLRKQNPTGGSRRGTGRRHQPVITGRRALACSFASAGPESSGGVRCGRTPRRMRVVPCEPNPVARALHHRMVIGRLCHAYEFADSRRGAVGQEPT